MIWSIIKGFFVGFSLTWIFFAILGYIVVHQLGYAFPYSGGAIWWCWFVGFVSAWRGRLNYKKKIKQPF